jgi:hypothetical protein
MIPSSGSAYTVAHPPYPQGTYHQDISLVA